MSTEQIIQIATTAGNLFTTLTIAFLYFKKGRKDKVITTTANIIKTIPSYIQNAKNLGLKTNTSIFNFVIAEIKEDFAEVLKRNTTKQINKEVKKEIEKETKQEN